jgi:CheY-like chemotaxis protein
MLTTKREVMKKKKILFIDDDYITLKISRLVIEDLGHDVVTISSGEEAIKFMSSKDIAEIDLIFMDLIMPQIDGIEVLRLMKSLNIQTTTIIQTALSESYTERQANIIKEARDLGPVDCIEKPYLKKDVQRLIDKYTANNYVKANTSVKHSCSGC